MKDMYYRDKKSGNINTEDEYKEIVKKEAWVVWNTMSDKVRKEEYDNDFEKIIKQHYSSNDNYEAGFICKDCNEFVGIKKPENAMDQANHYICPNCSN